MKKIIITFSKPPHGTSYYSEGLRLASGMGFDDHDTMLVFLGDGVFCALKNIDNKASEPFLETIAEFKYPFFVEKESLEKREIPETDLDPKFQVVSRENVSKFIKNSNIHIGV